MGLCGALVLVTSQALLSDRHGEYGAVAVTESNVTASACAIAAPLLVGASAAAGLGWRAALAVPVAALVLLAARVLVQAPRSSADAAKERRSGRRPDPAAALLGASGRSWRWAWPRSGASAYWGADFLADGTGLSRPAAATSLTAFFAAMLVGRIASSRLARTLPPTVLLAATLGVALVGIPALLVLSGKHPDPRRPLRNRAWHRRRLPAGRLGGHRLGAGKQRRGRREARHRRGRGHPRGPLRPGSPGRPDRHSHRLRHRYPHAPRSPVAGAHRPTTRWPRAFGLTGGRPGGDLDARLQGFA